MASVPGLSDRPSADNFAYHRQAYLPDNVLFIAEGYHYTRDIKKYTARLFVFAVISHFAYIFASNDFADWHSFIPFYYGNILNQTSVIWSLAWGLVLLRIADNSKIKMPAKVILTLLICAVALPADWSCIASLSVLSIGTNRGEPKSRLPGLCSGLQSIQLYISSLSTKYTG